jgi:hypothetical protein
MRTEPKLLPNSETKADNKTNSEAEQNANPGERSEYQKGNQNESNFTGDRY